MKTSYRRLIGFIHEIFNKDFTKKKLLLAFVLLLSFLILTFRLADNPPGFFIDESINGFEAYHLLTNRGYSSNGEFLPRFFMNPGESIRNHYSFIYFVAFMIAFLKESELAVRLTSVVFSILTMYLMYLLMQKKVSLKATIFFLLFWPFISWTFLISRIGMEFMASAFFFLLCMYSIVRMDERRNNGKALVVFFLSLLILFFIFAAGKVYFFGFLLLGLVVMRRNSYKLKHFMFILTTPIISALLVWRYLADGSFFYRCCELAKCIQAPLLCFIGNVFSHFNPNSYFKNTYIPPDYFVITHSIVGNSLLPGVFAPFLIIGLLIVISSLRRKDMFGIIFMFSALLAAIPSSLTERGFDSYRSSSLLPLAVVLAMTGFDFLYRRLFRLGVLSKLTWKIIITVFLVFFLAEQLYINFLYEYNIFAALPISWQYGYRQVSDFIKTEYENYDQFVITKSVAFLPHLYLRFFDPQAQLKKITLGSLVVCDKGRSLYIFKTTESFPCKAKVKKVIYYPDKINIAFYLFEAY